MRRIYAPFAALAVVATMLVGCSSSGGGASATPDPAIAFCPALDAYGQSLVALQKLDPSTPVDQQKAAVADAKAKFAALVPLAAPFAGDLAGLLGAARGAAGDLEDTGAEFAEHAGKRPALVVVGDASRVAAILRRRREAERPRMHRLTHQFLHLRELFGCRLDPVRGRFAHHIAANARMADQRADIDAALFAERVQIVADRFPGHVDTGL